MNASPSLRPIRSTTFLVLFISQMISLASLLLWYTLYQLLSHSSGALDTVGPVFQVYPVLPLSLSVIAWIAYRMQRWTVAMVCSIVPAALAFLLMSYYFVVGLAQHYV